MEIKEKINEFENRLKKIESKLDQLLNQEPHKIKESKRLKRESPREFLLNYNTKNDVEKTIVAISYLEEIGICEITIEEIRKTLVEMREKSSFNISDKIQQLDKRGFLVPNGQKEKKKLWLISNRGLEFLRELKKNARK